MKCIGFGEHKGKCENTALKKLHWCEECNKLRIEHISKQFEIIESYLMKQKESEGK